MSKTKSCYKRALLSLILGIGFGLLYGVLLRGIPWLQQLELNVYDTFVRWQNYNPPSKEILLLQMTSQEDNRQGIEAQIAEPIFDVSIVEQLLRHNAAVVVLNAPSNWHDYDLANAVWQKLIQQYSQQLILVVPESSVFNQEQIEWQLSQLGVESDRLFAITSQMIPIAELPNYELATTKNQNFFRILLDRPSTDVYSLPLLAVQKFSQQQDHYDALTEISLPSLVGIGYGVRDGDFTTLNLRQICVARISSVCEPTTNLNLNSLVANKIVLLDLDLPSMANLASDQIWSSSRSPMNLEAQIIASLLGDRYYRILPQWSHWMISLTGAIIVSGFLVFGMNDSRLVYPKHFIWLILGAIGLYAVLTVILWQHYYTLPTIIPLAIWFASAISTCVCLIMSLQKKLIAQQRHEIQQLQQAEDQAIMLQNRKLLQRVASDIHDTALQDIKVLMDKLELDANLDSEYILERLEFIGCQIREQLHSMRQMSQKLNISPILRSGLDRGIQAYLQQLTSSGRLTLSVVNELQQIDEPVANSDWIDAREDIYRFFREAINNVMFHAQPPHGNATQVRVSLECQQNRCFLVVADNNSENCLNNSTDDTLKPEKSTGYGTKIMETIAAELPGGTWQRTIAPQGGVIVQLSWILRF